MLRNNGEIAFYAISGIALSLAIWGFGLFGIKSQPFAAVLLFAAFLLNILLTYLGGKILGPESADAPVGAVLACGIFAFFLTWAANLGKDVLGSLALPVSLMFLTPSILYYIRQATARSESDVHAG
jgi:hypothetical protein